MPVTSANHSAFKPFCEESYPWVIRLRRKESSEQTRAALANCGLSTTQTWRASKADSSCNFDAFGVLAF
jgi:hypothetical protein